MAVSWLGKTTKLLFIFLFFLDLLHKEGVWESVTWQCHKSQVQMSQCDITMKLHDNCGKVVHCHDLAKRLSYYLYFFSWTYNYKVEHGKVSCDFVTIAWQMVMSRVTVTVCHITRVTWGPWKSKCIATVVKCISSREMSKNSIEFSLSNSEQRDSWLNSSHQTLDADMHRPYSSYISSVQEMHEDSIEFSLST